jgi:hypothetical protein
MSRVPITKGCHRASVTREAEIWFKLQRNTLGSLYGNPRNQEIPNPVELFALIRGHIPTFGTEMEQGFVLP